MIRALALAVLMAVPLSAAAQVPENKAQMQMSFAPVVKQAAPAVVNIYATRVVERRLPFADDPFFSQFFGEIDLPPSVQNALGSGVIVGGGLVVSNYHVVGNATDIQVVLADRREYTAQVVLTDEAADLAILRLEDAPALPALDFADSDGAEVGDLVLAIGNPFGVGQTVSSGIVSGLARTGQGGGALMRGGRYFIQTDAPINPGNSGGALVDMSGKLLGINTQIVTRSGGSNGIGFAIPANLVKQVVAQAAQGAERFERPFAGVEVQPVDQSMAQALGLDRPMGVIINRMNDESPFTEAGLVAGDVIVAVEDYPVNAAAELDFRLATHPMGGSVSVRYLSQTGWTSAEIALVPQPKGLEPTLDTITTAGPFQGMTVTRLTRNIAASLRAPSDLAGVVVIEATGRAAKAGFQRGDILLSVNRRAVATPDDLRAVVADPSGWWRVEFMRANRRITARFNG